MTLKLKPTLFIGYSLFMAGIFAMTALTFWEDKPAWVSWLSVLVMVIFGVLLVYIISWARKNEPPTGGKK